jgi:hypothetical protein
MFLVQGGLGGLIQKIYQRESILFLMPELRQ